jgi:hypothetical protein
MDPEGHLVAAGGVHVVHLGLERLAEPRVLRVLVVVEDDLLVQSIDIVGSHHQLNLK